MCKETRILHEKLSREENKVNKVWREKGERKLQWSNRRMIECSESDMK